MLLPVTQTDMLENAIKSRGPVFALFTARWCGNCSAFKPVVRRWFSNHGEVTALEIDVDRFEDVASKHRIQSMPTIMAFIGGERVARHSGAMTDTAFAKWAEKWFV